MSGMSANLSPFRAVFLILRRAKTRRGLSQVYRVDGPFLYVHNIMCQSYGLSKRLVTSSLLYILMESEFLRSPDCLCESACPPVQMLKHLIGCRWRRYDCCAIVCHPTKVVPFQFPAITNNYMAYNAAYAG
jgi:hypothetical protein